MIGSDPTTSTGAKIDALPVSPSAANAHSSLLPIASCVRDPFDVSREGNACTPDPFHEKVTRKNETANEARFGVTRLQLLQEYRQ